MSTYSNSELFRFVKVRNPEPRSLRPSPDVTEPRPITYDSQIASGSTVYSELLQLVESDEAVSSDYAGWAQTFRAGANHLPRQNDLNVIVPFDLLQTIRKANPITVAEAKALIASATGFDLDDPETDTAFVDAYTKVWDNLFVNLISAPPNAGMNVFLANALRALEFILQISKTAETDFDANWLAISEGNAVLIPEELVQRHPFADEPDEATDEEEYSAAGHQRKLLQTAESLTRARNLLQEVMDHLKSKLRLDPQSTLMLNTAAVNGFMAGGSVTYSQDDVAALGRYLIDDDTDDPAYIALRI